ncbi:MAG: type V CRISPR-associated protein Cas12a/Cpf1, partial [Epsilonproteobacteria bacterium]|nr:type V CRISPR-associated protein Cas12a/Cpf1 [Campylobacterota bacterium]
VYEKIEYKLLPGANKMLPKVFFSNKNIDYYNPSKKLLENYKDGIHKKGDNFDIDFCHELIDFFKVSIQKHEDWKHFKFNFSPTKSYEDLSGFYREVEQQGYKISYKNIDTKLVESWVNDGKLYLFQIYNKDFSPYSKGTPNMHTLYWKALFDEQNLANVVYKLNGQAEIFYRKKSIEYTEDKLKKGHHHEELKDKFAYPIIKDRRFAFDKFQFHVPITLNFKAEGNENLNQKTIEYIKTNDIKIIGIDRGERHLLYLSLIDLNGRIVEQYSLNQIITSYNGKEYPIDYHEKLAKKEDERALAREEWGVIENIKELKEGYISHVIHRITTLIVEHNAIVVLEDLNFGFKQGRFKVEKQVYQKFEKALIDKLNYLVDKKKTPSDLGGVLNALQLTNKFVSFEKMGKQNGFLFYVPAWNTSKIDPVTGFVNLFDTRCSSVEKAKEFFGKFKSIRYNSVKEYFEFEFDYNDFHNKALDTQTQWTICTYGERIKTFRNKDKNSQWDNETIHLTTAFKNHFGNYQGELKEYILAQDKKEFFEQLLDLFKLTLQMRNSITNSEVDYLISPVADKNGNFYDSRKADSSLPKDADANGAYNIARKGLMLVERIKESTDVKKVDFKLTNKEWLQFAQRG